MSDRRAGRRARAAGAALLLAVAASTAHTAGRAHEHGTAQADIAVDAGRLAITLDTPLENLLGFERAPRSDAERTRVDGALARLRDVAALWRIDPAAQCVPAATVALEAPALGLGAAAAAGAAAEHAQLQAEYAFACRGAIPAWVETTLFDAFPRLQRLDVQVAAPRGQAQRVLRRGAVRIDLVRGR